jgi:hypothetical protein
MEAGVHMAVELSLAKTSPKWIDLLHMPLGGLLSL